MLNWPEPANRKELERFLGFINYHRNYLQALAGKTAILFALLGACKKWAWTDEHAQAFYALRQAMTEAPVLAYPNATDLFILDTDASDFAIGAELSQLQDGKERTISYDSKSLCSKQQGYCTTRKELLAVVVFVRHYQHYLLGRKFVVRTDHASLVWLMRFKNPGGQICRWLQELSNFDFSIQHRQGNKHSNADGLSRIPERHPCDCYVAGQEVSTLPCGGCEHYVKLQRHWHHFEEDVDDVLPLSLKHLTKTAPEVQEETADVRIVELEDISEPSEETSEPGLSSQLYQAQAGQFQEVRPVESSGESNFMAQVTQQVIRDAQMRDSDIRPVIGWLESDKPPGEAELQMQSSTDVKLHVATCAPCNQSKVVHRKPRAPMQLYQAGIPGDRLHLDMLGPFCEYEAGNHYVFMIVDQFTRWLEVVSLPTQDAQSVARAFFESYVVRFGVPLTVHTDQGRNFESDLFAAFCDLLDAAKTRTTPYRPSANGQVEHYNQLVLNYLRCYLGSKQREWDKFLPALGMAVRVTVHWFHTKYAPAGTRSGHASEYLAWQRERS